MKFHCDRCKTRYSISDDRVRGKILKIRCKNCSAVITVREGMSEPSGASPGSAQSPGVARAASRSTGPQASRIITPRPSSEEPRPKRSSLEGAFKHAISSPEISPSDSMQAVGPPGYDVEWYVSLDGDQRGPFSLPDAQRWVQGRDFDDELYCWSEGFDDWLSVEQVSQFQGLRAPPQDDPAFGDERTVVGAPPDFSNPALRDALSAPASSLTYPSAAAPMPERSAPKIPLAAAQPVVSQPLAAQSPAASPASRPMMMPERQPMTSEPLSLPPRPMASGSPVPVLHNTPTPQPLFARTLEQMEANAPTGIVDPHVPGSNGKNSDLIQMPPSPDTEMHDSDLELDIGEASRVVKLPHLAQMALQGNNGPAPVTHHGLPGVGSQKLGSGTGPMGSVSNRTGPTGLPQFSMEAPRPELLQPRRRSGLLPLIIGGGVVLAAVIGLLVFLAVRGDNVDDEPIARRTTTRSTDNLGKDYTADFTSTRPSKSDDGTKVEIENPKDSGSKGARTAKKPRTGNGESQSNTTSANTRSGGDDEVDLGSGSKDKVVQGFLDPGVVQQAYRKYSISMQRCFEQALKKDPYLKAPKATVAIEVSPAGRVTRVSIPALSGKYLGGCLTGAIKRWKFQRSTKGLSTTFPVVFKS